MVDLDQPWPLRNQMSGRRLSEKSAVKPGVDGSASLKLQCTA